MSMVNLYVQIGNSIIKGRIIQSVYFSNQDNTVVVTYISNYKKTIQLSAVITEEEITRIFNEICAIHEAECYPSGSNPETGCPLGVASL